MMWVQAPARRKGASVRFKHRLLRGLGLDALDLTQPQSRWVAVVAAAFLKLIITFIGLNIVLVAAGGHNRQTVLFIVSLLGVALLVAALRLIDAGHVRVGTWLGTLTPMAVSLVGTTFSASLAAAPVLWALVGVVFCTFVLGLRAGCIAALLALGGFAAVGVATAYGLLAPRISPHPYNQWVGLLTPMAVLLLASGLIRESLLISTHLQLQSSAAAAFEREERLAHAREAAQSLREEVRARTASLEKAVGDLRTLNYLLSHDLSGGVATIRAWAGLLREQESARISEEGARRLSRIEVNARELQAMIEGLLTFSRMSALEPAVTEVELGATMRTVAEALAPEWPGVRIEWDTATLRTDATMLRHILQNLVGNACKHGGTHAGAHVDVRVTATANENVVCVADDGPGLAPGDEARVFELFQRGAQEPAQAGHGVGLAVVRYLVERLGGRVWAEDARKDGARGARFFFSLPREPR